MNSVLALSSKGTPAALVAQNYVLLLCVRLCEGFHPSTSPPETEFLDFQLGLHEGVFRANDTKTVGVGFFYVVRDGGFRFL